MVHYPESGHTRETLEIIAEDYYEAFKDSSGGSLELTYKVILKECRFFPKIADFKEHWQSDGLRDRAREEKWIEYQRSRKQIAETPSYKSEHDIENAKKEIDNIIRSITKKSRDFKESKELKPWPSQE